MTNNFNINFKIINSISNYININFKINEIIMLIKIITILVFVLLRHDRCQHLLGAVLHERFEVKLVIVLRLVLNIIFISGGTNKDIIYNNNNNDSMMSIIKQ